MVFLVILLTPFVIFLAGAYVLNYPLTVGILYAFNLALIYVVLWAVGNQVVKVFTQKLSINGDSLILARKELFLRFPMLADLDLAIPLKGITDFSLKQTRIGYLFTLRFNQEGKTMGVDLDLNPLRPENGRTLSEVLAGNPKMNVDEETKTILAEYSNKALSWRGSYLFSFFILGMALVIFFVVSVYLGTKVY